MKKLFLGSLLSGNELKGRWQLSSEGGSSGWETFQAQRLVWPFFP